MSIFDSTLINDKVEACVILNKTIVLDGYGGYKTVYVEGAPFDAVITENSSIDAKVAGVELATSFYGVKVERNVPLEFNSVFKRKKDNSTYRITVENAMDTPSFSVLNMKALQAEQFTIVQGEIQQ